MEKQTEFKSALFGFDREQVLTCMDEMIRENMELEAKAEQDRQAMLDRMEALEKRNRELEKQVAALRASLDAERTIVFGMQAKFDQIDQKRDRAERQANDLRRRLFAREQDYQCLEKEKQAMEAAPQSQPEPGPALCEPDAIEQAVREADERHRCEMEKLRGQAEAEKEALRRELNHALQKGSPVRCGDVQAISHSLEHLSEKMARTEQELEAIVDGMRAVLNATESAQRGSGTYTRCLAAESAEREQKRKAARQAIVRKTVSESEDLLRQLCVLLKK